MSFRLQENKVLFLSDQRDELGANLKCLYDRVSTKKFNKILLLRHDRFKKQTLKEKWQLMYHITTSKYIILDDWNPAISLIKRRKRQEIIQLWHGPGAFKKFGYSRMDHSRKASKYSMHRNYTKAIVTAEDIRWCFAEGFGMDIVNVKATGYPRTDCFFDEKYKDKIKRNFYKKYPQLKDKKIILFAPTYRGNSLPNAHYDFDKLDLKKLKESLNDDYAFIIKWHPAIYNNINRHKLQFDISEYEGFVYDFSNERDINDLLIVTDILITDYSSVIFDYLLLDKPLIYYTYDLDEYRQERGLYFDFDEYVYGTIATDMNELVKNIKGPNMDRKKREKFNKKFMSACDGHATDKVYDFIFGK